MGESVSFKNRDRFLEIGIAIAAHRRMQGFSQEQLAEKAGIGRSHLSAIEAPNLAHNFTLEVFFNITDALNVKPSDLLDTSLFQTIK